MPAMRHNTSLKQNLVTAKNIKIKESGQEKKNPSIHRLKGFIQNETSVFSYLFNLNQILALCFLFARTTATRTRRSQKRPYNLANDAIGAPECYSNRDPILPVGHIIIPIQVPFQSDTSQTRRYRRAPSYKQTSEQATAKRPFRVE